MSVDKEKAELEKRVGKAVMALMEGILEAEAARIMEVGLRLGIREGIWRYAVYQDGLQVVGVRKEPLKEVLARVDKEDLSRLMP